MKKRLDLDALFAVVEPAFRVPLDLAPDGRALSVTVKRSNARASHGEDGYAAGGVPSEMVGSRVAVVDVDDGTIRWPFGESAVSWAGRWSPDGERLAAYVRDQAAACLGIWERQTGAVALFREVLVRPFFGFEVPRWTPDSASVVVKVRAEEDVGVDLADPSESHSLVRRFSFDPANPEQGSGMPGWAGGYRAELAVVDVMSGGSRRLTSGWRGIGWEVAPDGSRVAALRYRRSEEELQQFRYELLVVPLHGRGPEVVIATEIAQGYGNAFSWSPDAAFLAYVSDARGERPLLFVVPSDGSSAPRDLTPPQGDLALSEDQPPRWSVEGDRIFWPLRTGHWETTLDGSAVQRVEVKPGQEMVTWVQSPANPVMALAGGSHEYLIRRSDARDLCLVRLHEDGQPVEVAELPGKLVSWSWGLERDPEGIIYLLLEASDHPPELWKLSGSKSERLISFNRGLEGFSVGRSVLVRYRSLEGRRLAGSLLLPPDHQEGTPVPLIVDVYGGGLGSRHHHSFGGSDGVVHAQLLAARGYGVLSPDMPMGETDPLRQLPGLVLPAINQLIDLGIADPERLGLMGHSYGGYCTMALLTQTEIFAAAVASSGSYDLISAALSMRSNGAARWIGWAESGQGRMGGSLWEKRASYIENSPVFYLDRVTTPVLLSVGTADLGSPAQVEEVYVGLRRLNKRVELVEYEGEEHWPGMWTEPAYRDYATRVIAWFDQHLSPQTNT